MAFTTAALNEFLKGFRSAVNDGNATFVAVDTASQAGDVFVDYAQFQYEVPANAEMDLDDDLVFEADAGDDITAIRIYEGQPTNQNDMENSTILAEVTFNPGTYAFTNPGTLTVNSFEISLVNE